MTLARLVQWTCDTCPSTLVISGPEASVPFLSARRSGWFIYRSANAVCPSCRVGVGR